MSHFTHVVIAKPALKRLKAFVRSVWKIEIGGPMVGFVFEDSLVITDLDGPGSAGRCSTYSVMIDGESSKLFCDEAYRGSGGLLDFVGDWHCHPSFSVRPSGGDERAMEILSETEGLTPTPVSLIYGTILKRFTIYRWDESEKCLVPISHKVVSQEQIDELVAISKAVGE